MRLVLWMASATIACCVWGCTPGTQKLQQQGVALRPSLVADLSNRSIANDDAELRWKLVVGDDLDLAPEPRIKRYRADIDGDGDLDDVTETDFGADGKPDKWTADTDGDGKDDYSVRDNNNDGIVDEWSFEEDVDGDGIKDRVTVNDLNHDGRPDFWDVDLGNDGDLDELTMDEDRDGKPDRVIIPKEGDRKRQTFKDLDGDGNADTEATDDNNDGKWDHGFTDEDRDGRYDHVWTDDDKDGEVDEDEVRPLEPGEEGGQTPKIKPPGTSGDRKLPKLPPSDPDQPPAPGQVTP